MPPRVLTIREILVELNGPTGIGEWNEVRNLNTLPSVEVNGSNSISISSTSGIVTKAFINRRTAEIKIFVAKSIDIPERPNL